MKPAVCFLFACLFVSAASAGVVVEMWADGGPVDLIMMPKGFSKTIDFSLFSSDLLPEFTGIVELVGVGTLTPPQYYGSPIVSIPPILPPNQWPLFYVSGPQIPAQGPFAYCTYNATDWGIAAVNLYQSDAAFTEMRLIDSLQIVVAIVPEPCTLLLLGAGALTVFVRKSAA